MRTYKDYCGQHAIRISICMAFLALLITPISSQGIEARIKDISRVAGLEEVELIGYGIVSGLGGTGDKDLMLTKQTVANLMENFQIQLSSGDIKSKNVAAVAVIARVPPFHKANDRVDIKVSSMGDASSLEGGVLMMTPMLDPNGEFYALAQGSLTVGGFSAGQGGAGGATVQKNHVTTALVPGGAVLKMSQSTKFYENGILRLVLRNPDFTTADRMASAINKELGGIAVAKDAGTVSVNIPQEKLDIGQASAFIAKLERISLSPDVRAKVIVNERTGTIVMGGDVHISEAVVAHGNLTVTVKETLRVSQPTDLTLVGANVVTGSNVLANVRMPPIGTAVVPDVETKAEEEKARVMLVPNLTTVRELADMLNFMGATPRDLISILEALRELGALQMELVSM
ncbi:MAG: hypothetical protein A2283_02260 [Lentisphaerae bacterium RIFOXYA12_FULL_48_11]|nr:MAG: hypothetical protein A2283_02260 [Lentisphaerae bacterium RIFOXYA12_FULL_48_11]